MTQFEQDVTRQLGELSAGIKAIQDALDRDYNHLHGNGKPGLLDRVKELEDWRMACQHHYGAVAVVIAFIVNAAIALYAALK